jgi:hypothetical protein
LPCLSPPTIVGRQGQSAAEGMALGDRLIVRCVATRRRSPSSWDRFLEAVRW